MASLLTSAIASMPRFPPSRSSDVAIPAMTSGPEGKYRIRALRGYIRIARQLSMTPDERMTVCRQALALAERLLVAERSEPDC